MEVYDLGGKTVIPRLKIWFRIGREGSKVFAIGRISLKDRSAEDFAVFAIKVADERIAFGT